MSTYKLNYLLRVDNIRNSIFSNLTQLDQLNVCKVFNLLYDDFLYVKQSPKRLKDLRQFWEDVKRYGESIVLDIVHTQRYKLMAREQIFVTVSCYELFEVFGIDRGVLERELTYRADFMLQNKVCHRSNSWSIRNNCVLITIYFTNKLLIHYFRKNMYEGVSYEFISKYPKKHIDLDYKCTKFNVMSWEFYNPCVYELIEVSESRVFGFDRWQSILPLTFPCIELFTEQLNHLPGTYWSIKATVNDKAKLVRATNMFVNEPVQHHWSFVPNANNVIFIDADQINGRTADTSQYRINENNKGADGECHRVMVSEPFTVCEFFRQLNLNDIVHLAEYHENHVPTIKLCIDHELLLYIYVKTCINKYNRFYNDTIAVPNIVSRTPKYIYTINYQDLPLNQYMSYTIFDKKVERFNNISYPLFVLGLDSGIIPRYIHISNDRKYVKLRESDIIRTLSVNCIHEQRTD